MSVSTFGRCMSYARLIISRLISRPVRTSHTFRLKSQIHASLSWDCTWAIIARSGKNMMSYVNGVCGNGTTCIIIGNDRVVQSRVCFNLDFDAPRLDSDFVNYDLHIMHIGPGFTICIIHAIMCGRCEYSRMRCLASQSRRNRDWICMPQIIDRIFQKLHFVTIPPITGDTIYLLAAKYSCTVANSAIRCQRDGVDVRYSR